MSARHEMTHAGISFRQGWRFSITPSRLVLMAISAISLALIMFRLDHRAGAGHQFERSWALGLMDFFDVMCGVALAGGGYGTALIVYTFPPGTIFQHRPQRRPDLSDRLSAGDGRVVPGYRPMVEFLAAAGLARTQLCPVRGFHLRFDLHHRAGGRIRCHHRARRAEIPRSQDSAGPAGGRHRHSHDAPILLGALYLLMVDKLHPLWCSSSFSSSAVLRRPRHDRGGNRAGGQGVQPQRCRCRF